MNRMGSFGPMLLDLIRPYRDVLRPRQHVLLLGAGLIARIPVAVLGFATLLLVRSTTGSYGSGGLVAGATVAAGALAGPVLARRADRHGQESILRVLAAGHLLTAALLVLAAASGAATALLVVAAAMTGATVTPVGSFTRARWSHIYRRAPALKVAFVLEAVLDEVVWIVGPAGAALVAALSSPAVGLVLSGVCGAAGNLLLARQRATAPPRAPSGGPARRFRPLASPRIAAVLGAGLVVGLSFGVDNVSAVARTEADGVPALAGLILAVAALGSVAGGAVLGAVPERLAPYRLFVATCAVMAVAYAPLAIAPNTYWVMAASLLAGASVSPYMVAANRVVDAAVPREVVTEALAWTNTAVLVGMAGGGWLGGVVVEAWGPRRGYLTVSLLCLAPVLLALAGGSVPDRHTGAYAPETRHS